MFVLAELKDTVRITPDHFNLRLPDAIKNEINRKLANKVLLNVGLCIALKDIQKLGDSIILPGDGSSHTEVWFRYIVFRAIPGEVLTGKIQRCNRDGVHGKTLLYTWIREKGKKIKCVFSYDGIL